MNSTRSGVSQQSKQYGDRGEEEGELRARVPGVDVRIPPAYAYASERLGEYLRPPATRLHFRPHTQDIFGQCHWRHPLGSRRLLESPVCCLEELRFIPMQCKPRIHHFVTLSECHSPIELYPTIARQSARPHSAFCGEKHSLPGLAFSLPDPFEALCWTVSASSQHDIFNCALLSATRTRSLVCRQLSLAATCASFRRADLGGSSGSMYGESVHANGYAGCTALCL
jgi:hypothetical protein